MSLSSLGLSQAQTTSVVSGLPSAAPHIASFAATVDMWQGFKRYRFTVDGCACWIAEPKAPRPGNPWAWCMMFPDDFPVRTGATGLLDQGYYYVFMDVGNTFGAPSALAHLSAFYAALTGAGFKTKAFLIGISRGGAMACNWGAQNPGKVSGIYGDAPVCSFASWPYAHGAGKNSPDWKQLLSAYGFKTDQEALSCPTQPIHEMEPLARAHISLLCVVGDADNVVPYAENTAIIEEEYKKRGCSITVLHKPGCGHHPHGLDDPAPIINFALGQDR